jgi:hypothetical protein
MKIWPEVDVRVYPRESSTEWELTTHVRVQADNGDHYLQRCTNLYLVQHGTTKPAEDMSNLVSQFIMNCYVAIMFTTPDPELTDVTGKPIWIKDNDQRSDMERLRAMTWPPEEKKKKTREWWED